MKTHLEFSGGVANLIDVRQRAIVLRPGLSQAKLLDLLKLHLFVTKGKKKKHKKLLDIFKCKAHITSSKKKTYTFI